MSNYSVPGFLKRDKDSLLFSLPEGELIFYVPELFFERNYAEFNGEYVSLIGILDYAIFNKDGKHSGLKRFNFPSKFTCKPREIEKIKSVKLTEFSKEQDYRLLKFGKNDEVISSVFVAKDVENAEYFYKMFLCGKIPTTIPYTELQNYFIENINLNGADYGLNMQLFGIIVAEMCRDIKDIKKLFRHTDMKNKYAYQTIDIKQAPKYISPYSAITSENWDEAVVNAMMNKNTKYTPMEKLLSGR